MNSFFCPLSNLELIALEGEKAADFLQGQVTCDVREIQDDQTRRAAHCNPKGRILSTFRVLKFAKRFYLLVPASMVDLIIVQLKKYAIFSKVILKRDDSLKVIGCVGKEIAETLEEILGKLPEEPDQAVFYSHNILVTRVQGILPRFEIIGLSEAIISLQKTLVAKYQKESEEPWRLWEINSGVPTIYPETCDLFTPQMLNYPALNAVSFKKGCYTGQEVIARTHYLGKVKRHLHTLNLKIGRLPKPGDMLYDADKQAVGTVIDAALQTIGECRLLAVVQDGAILEKLYLEEK